MLCSSATRVAWGCTRARSRALPTLFPPSAANSASGPRSFQLHISRPCQAAQRLMPHILLGVFPALVSPGGSPRCPSVLHGGDSFPSTSLLFLFLFFFKLLYIFRGICNKTASSINTRSMPRLCTGDLLRIVRGDSCK